MISASHNPFGDNGIKLFTAGGRKLSDEVEERLEPELTALSTQGDPRPRPAGAEVGTIAVDHDGGRPLPAPPRRRRASPAGALGGLKVVLDGANGAASELAAEVFEALGATVIAIHDRARRRQHQRGLRLDPPRGPAGRGGRPRRRRWAWPSTATPTGCWPSTPTARSSTATRSSPSAPSTATSGACSPHDTVVVTVMSNLGFRQGMAAHGIDVVDHRRRRPLRARGARRGQALPRRRAVRPRHLPGPGLHRRRHAHRASPCLGDGPPGPIARRPGRRGHGPAAAGAGQRAHRPPRPGAARAARSPRSMPPRTGSATGAGCCCAPAAPSR